MQGLYELDLSHNNFADHSVLVPLLASLNENLNNLESLGLSNCPFTEPPIEVPCPAILSENPPHGLSILQRIDLSDAFTEPD